MRLQTTNLKIQINQKRGYTLLFAVITAALVLGVAVFILSVSKKQYALSVAARDSMYSLYAADSAMECVAATDIATGTPSSPRSIAIQCNGRQNNPAVPFTGPISSGLDPVVWPQNNLVAYQASEIPVVLDNDTCALVTITDGYYSDGSTLQHKTVVDLRGYNYCDENGRPISSSRTVERALRLTYR